MFADSQSLKLPQRKVKHNSQRWVKLKYAVFVFLLHTEIGQAFSISLKASIDNLSIKSKQEMSLLQNQMQ